MAADKNIPVFGIYASRENAENGVDRLLSSGFCQEDISVLLQDNVSTRDFAHEKQTKAPEGAATGVVAGGVIGGALGLLAHIGVIAIPGLGPLIAVGPIIAALTGIGSGTLVGGIIGALVGMGVPEYEAKRFEGRIKTGAILVSVTCHGAAGTITKAQELLRQTGAEEISRGAGDRAELTDSGLARGAAGKR